MPTTACLRLKVGPMLRRREVAAAPQRSASETWQAITRLVIDTLETSPHINTADVESMQLAAGPIGKILVAGGHLDRACLTLVAGSVHCEFSTISGADALRLEENLGPVPGGASATDFTLYLPSPAPLESAVKAAAQSHDHLSAAAPPEPTSAEAASSGPLVNLDALRREAAL